MSRLLTRMGLGLLLSSSLAFGAEISSGGSGIPSDWSHSRLAMNQSASIGTRVLSRDPRVLANLSARAAASRPAFAARRKKSAPLLGDWSVSMGGGNVAAGMSPAKFNFFTTGTIDVTNCTTDFVVYPLNVPGVSGAAVATISSISRASNVVTVTTSAAHGFTVGLHVTINGVANASFNGNYVIASAPTTTSFTYAQTASNASSSGGTANINQADLVGLNALYTGSLPAGNNGLCGFGSGTISSAIRSSNVVTITTTAAHNFAVGDSVTVTGVTDTGFNGNFVVASTPTATSFTFSQAAPDASSSGGTAAGSARTYFAYATASATCSGAPCPNAGNFTSPSIAFDSTGSKIAFLESASDATATCPGRAGTGACSIFHVLTWKANEGSILAPVVPGQGGSTASLVSITYSSSANTSSSPWIDYTNDAAYVGADDGKIYRITGVFAGTPTLDSSFGDVPGTPGVTITGNQRLSPPVQVVGAGLNTGYIFVGDALGNVKALSVSTRTIVGSVLVGGGNVNPAVLDPTVVYYDPVGNPNYISVFAFTASTSGFGSFPSGASSINQNRGAVIQLLLDITGPSFTVVSGLDMGKGANGGTFVTFHTGAFDNTFYTTPTSGFLYGCGTQTNQPWPAMYRIPFTNALASPRNLVPTISSTGSSNTSFASFTSNVDCSPLTEFANPNLAGATDLLFFGLSGNAQVADSWNITGALQPSAFAQAANQPGGTSAMIVDNQLLSAGNGTSQGSSVYFTTLAAGNTCGNNTRCAVKLRQLDLK